MRLFYAGAELRWLMSSTEWPDSIEFREAVEALKKTYQDNTRGTRALDVFNATPTSSDAERDLFAETYASLKDVRMDEQEYSVFVDLLNIISPNTFTAYNADLTDERSRLSRNVRLLPKLEVGRVTYGTRADQVRNSFVCFKDPCSSDPTLVRAGQIAQIFIHRRFIKKNQPIIEPFIVVDEYMPLTTAHVLHDPYRRFPIIDTRLYYSRFHARSPVVRREDLVSHFAMFECIPEGIEEPCIVMRSLDRVRLLYSSKEERD